MVELNGDSKETVVESVVDQVAEPVVVSTAECENGSSPKTSDEDVISPSKPVQCKKMKLDVNGDESDVKNSGEVTSNGAATNGKDGESEVQNGDSHENGTNEAETLDASTEKKTEDAVAEVEKMETENVEVKAQDHVDSSDASSDQKLDGSADTNGDSSDSGSADTKGNPTDATNVIKLTDEAIEKKAEDDCTEKNDTSPGDSEKMETSNDASVSESSGEKSKEDDSTAMASTKETIGDEGTTSPGEPKSDDVSPVGETCEVEKIETGVTNPDETATTENAETEKKDTPEDENKPAEPTEPIGTEAKSDTCDEAAKNEPNATGALNENSEGESTKESNSIAEKTESTEVPETGTPVQQDSDKGAETSEPVTEELKVTTNETAAAKSEVDTNTDTDVASTDATASDAAKTDEAIEKPEN